MPKFLVMVSSNADDEVEVEPLEAMYPNEHFSVDAKDKDDAAQIAIVLHNQNVPEEGIHLLEPVGDDWTKYSSVYTVLDCVPPLGLPEDAPDEEQDKRVDWLHKRTCGYFTIVGPLKED
jgi:hypothetical protein